MGKLSQDAGPINQSGRLRELIDQSEKALAVLNSENARQLLLDVDQAYVLLDSLIASGADLRGEQNRLSTIDERVVKDAAKVVRSVGGRRAYILLRDTTAKEKSIRIWALDQQLDANRNSLLQRLGILIGIIAVILAAGYIARPVLFPPDPVGDAVAAATRSLQTNDIPGALAAVDSTLSQIPTSTDLLIWKGILLEKAGDLAGSKHYFELGLASVISDKDFYLDRAITYVRIGDSPHVISDMDILLAKYPDNAEAYYVRASGYEGVGKRAEAMADLAKSAELAQATGNDALYAQAKVRLGTMMQAGQ